MKKSLLLTAITSAVLLSACAKQPAPPAQPDNNQQATTVSVTTAQTQDNPDVQENTQAPADVPNARVQLTVEGDRLIARMWTNWNGSEQNSLFLKWIAPQNSGCISTTFPIQKYGETNDYSWAYRTLDVGSGNRQVYCSGTWQAQVIDRNSQSVVGSATLNVPAK